MRTVIGIMMFVSLAMMTVAKILENLPAFDSAVGGFACGVLLWWLVDKK